MKNESSYDDIEIYKEEELSFFIIGLRNLLGSILYEIYEYFLEAYDGITESQLENLLFGHHKNRTLIIVPYVGFVRFNIEGNTVSVLDIYFGIERGSGAHYLKKICDKIVMDYPQVEYIQYRRSLKGRPEVSKYPIKYFLPKRIA